mgnify:CR=1 FL=1
MAALVEIERLDFAFWRHLVLKQITLTIERGSILGLIGPNGGGKTTLLRLMLARHRPTRGRIAIDGLPPDQAVAKGNVLGYLPQNHAIPENFPITVRQVVRLGLAGKIGLLRPCPREDLDFVESLLERVGLADLADWPIGLISGGQRQRVLIARALAARPRLLLLDEPTTGIDRSGQQDFMEFLVDLRRQLDLTVVLVSHDLQTVSALCDRIACLNVTLHYHDVPHRLPEDLAHRMFSCDLEAMGIRPTGP